MWKYIFPNRAESTETKPLGHRVEVFSRHCFFSAASAHKKRSAYFSREKCLRNLLQTLDQTRTNLTFLLDIAKGQEHFTQNYSDIPTVTVHGGTEAKAFLALLDYVEEQNFHPDTILYFVEDDYLHRSGWLDTLLEGFTIPEADYVTLYDHKDKYFYPSYKELTSKLFLTPSSHWRTIPSTTQTFAVRMKTLKKDLPIHHRFSENCEITADHEKFSLLTKLGRTIISPIPGWSTHSEPEFASPRIDWESLLQQT